MIGNRIFTPSFSSVLRTHATCDETVLFFGYFVVFLGHPVNEMIKSRFGRMSMGYFVVWCGFK